MQKDFFGRYYWATNSSASKASQLYFRTCREKSVVDHTLSLQPSATISVLMKPLRDFWNTSLDMANSIHFMNRRCTKMPNVHANKATLPSNQQAPEVRSKQVSSNTYLGQTFASLAASLAGRIHQLQVNEHAQIVNHQTHIL